MSQQSLLIASKVSLQLKTTRTDKQTMQTKLEENNLPPIKVQSRVFWPQLRMKLKERFQQKFAKLWKLFLANLNPLYIFWTQLTTPHSSGLNKNFHHHRYSLWFLLDPSSIPTLLIQILKTVPNQADERMCTYIYIYMSIQTWNEKRRLYATYLQSVVHQ